jgi:RNA polymerase sigma factor (sigma-70 family)
MASTTRALRRPPLRGDESELFRRHHRRLLALVARDVSAGPQVIEDACAYAWLELVARQPERTNIIGWLRVVARREALRLACYDRRLFELAAERPDERCADRRSARQEARDALRHLVALPVRKRAVLTLQVSGHSYGEIAAELRMSPRTVERQLLRARAAVRHARREALAT